MKMVLTKMFEEVVEPTFHYNSRGMSNKGSSTTPPVDTLENIQRLYGKKTLARAQHCTDLSKQGDEPNATI